MKKLGIGTIIGLAVTGIAFAFIVFGTFQAPRTSSIQHGYRGTGMDLIYHRAEITAAETSNKVPKVIPASAPVGTKASTIYKNLKVLGDVDVGEFGRIMASMSAWVAPTQSCAYCHGASGNFASDDLYTKRVARRMLQMTRHINVDWKDHVGKTGVVCYTCHRGQPVPAYVWFNTKSSPNSRFGTVSVAGADSALPANPYTPFLDKADEIRVISTTALPGTDKQGIQQAEYTYSLMMAFSKALGVNCTFCHNTRSFAAWDQSSPQRATAWYGIRMVRDLNDNFMGSLQGTFPKYRLGPEGDVAKLNCMTCHQGAYKPLLGAKVAEKFQELETTADASSVAAAPKPPEPAPAPATPPAAAPAPAPAPPAAAPPASDGK